MFQCILLMNCATLSEIAEQRDDEKTYPSSNISFVAPRTWDRRETPSNEQASLPAQQKTWRKSFKKRTTGKKRDCRLRYLALPGREKLIFNFLFQFISCFPKYACSHKLEGVANFGPIWSGKTYCNLARDT